MHDLLTGMRKKGGSKTETDRNIERARGGSRGTDRSGLLETRAYPVR